MTKKKALIIVESPSKIKTLRKFLGDEYLFESSVGHIRDLPEKAFGIDLENDFEPNYETLADKKEVIAKLIKASKECETVYLSPDPDREGEAIAWHISQILPPKTKMKRVTFNSITKDAVLKGINNPREIDMAMVNAQQARRLLDRIVGYKISPILNRRIQRGKNNFVSAGRVQSVSLKLVVDREKEIEAFKPQEFWNIFSLLQKKGDDKVFKGHLFTVKGKKVEKEPVEGKQEDKDFILINSEEKATQILNLFKDAIFKVVKVDKKEKKRNAPPPFITSTLQQEASRHFGFSSSRTMNIAQSLYEGIDLGQEGTEGLITYMRTDSVHVVGEAIDEARDYIKKVHGGTYLPHEAKSYSSKEGAQEAHEAIRPTHIFHTPEKVESFLNRDQFLLYSLIWKRFLSSQMNPAIYDTVSLDIEAGKDLLLRASGSVMKFPGFLVLYEEKKDDDDKEEEEDKMLPELSVGDILSLIDLKKEQGFTRPPPRFTEASLVKELEKSGIGRPSTYTSIMSKIQGREYTVKEAGRLKPTELGRVIAEMLEVSFQKIMDVGFTASMEDDLELIAEKKKDWKELIRTFWTDFAPTLEIAEKTAFVPKVMTDIPCPSCGKPLQKIWFKSKYFYGCSDYPTCSFSAPLEELHFDKAVFAEDFNWTQPCPQCGGEMKVRHGKYGAFLGCLKYPDCKGIINIPKKGEVVIKQEDLPECVAVGCTGHMVARKSRFGKTFFSCSTFPECDVIVNSLEELHSKYPDHPKTAYVKKEKFKKKKGAKEETPAKGKKGAKTTKATKTSQPKEKSTKVTGFTKPFHLSPALQKVVGTDSLSRGDSLKKIWDYIKEHNLQNPANKREIIPDEALAAVFETKENVNMFKIAGLLGKHLS